ncbi:MULTISPECIES: BMC domain-containing protein [Enterococcaceae]|uniref:BMC domain-containing protein n=1 Tax=Enterococcaceae TaxID=81852 RepID=UPI000E4906C4|nr:MULTISPECIES: BMC domain-containing protein [Enterococcaceae]MCI0130371.1 BMC domain-containing protein [Vagococcus sp. CY53-2]RGI32101.1 BMC domain-containing protein [Melissococcus sp. OM08-11BH]UNM89806.1 BMC domain-containing protein [Vagococcus sp. CY52-2]
MLDDTVKRVIEESVPGKQVTLAHVIASPIEEIYESLGIENEGAIGILTISPFETAIIAADIAGKSADVQVGFLDRFTGSVLISGDVQSVEEALQTVVNTLKQTLNYEVVKVTRT